MTSNTTQLIFELQKGQAQFAYFQLGVAASAMAFAIHETGGLPLADAPWALGLAVTLWALSFALGCFGIDARQDGIQSNAAFLRAFGDLSAQPVGSEGANVVARAKDAVAKDLRKPVTRFRWQKWTLFAGALFYIGGHIMQMAALPAKGAATRGDSFETEQPAQVKPLS
jgi:hypothetical protein